MGRERLEGEELGVKLLRYLGYSVSRFAKFFLIELTKWTRKLVLK